MTLKMAAAASAFHRQEDRFARLGQLLDRGTMCLEWVAVEYEQVKDRRGMLRSALGYAQRQA